MGMMDLEDKESLPQDMNENKKCCTGCKTTETPLWRGGPAGPKSLCNACGIRYRKKRAAGMGVSQGTTTERKREKRRRKFCFVNKRRRKWKDLAQLGEVEQAAVSLLALSCDSVFSWRRGQM